MTLQQFLATCVDILGGTAAPADVKAKATSMLSTLDEVGRFYLVNRPADFMQCIVPTVC